MFEIEGRTALVTGAGKGMGLGIAATLGRAGAAVYLNDLSETLANEAAERLRADGIDVTALPFDVTDSKAFAAARDFVAPIDILVSNAGIPVDGGRPKQFLDIPIEEWRLHIDLNLYGVMNGVHTLLPGMMERGFGRIVTISSDSSRTGVVALSVYSASKAGARQFTRCIAKEAGAHGVTANIVSLGLMDNVPDELLTAFEPIIRQTPVARAGSPLDVGAAVAFLSSNEAEWITGQTLSVNGGYATY